MTCPTGIAALWKKRMGVGNGSAGKGACCPAAPWTFISSLGLTQWKERTSSLKVVLLVPTCECFPLYPTPHIIHVKERDNGSGYKVELACRGTWGLISSSAENWVCWHNLYPTKKDGGRWIRNSSSFSATIQQVQGLVWATRDLVLNKGGNSEAARGTYHQA